LTYPGAVLDRPCGSPDSLTDRDISLDAPFRRAHWHSSALGPSGTARSQDAKPHAKRQSQSIFEAVIGAPDLIA